MCQDSVRSLGAGKPQICQDNWKWARSGSYGKKCRWLLHAYFQQAMQIECPGIVSSQLQYTYICIQFFVFILDLFANLFAFLFGDIYLKLTEFLSQQWRMPLYDHWQAAAGNCAPFWCQAHRGALNPSFCGARISFHYQYIQSGLVCHFSVMLQIVFNICIYLYSSRKSSCQYCHCYCIVCPSCTLSTWNAHGAFPLFFLEVSVFKYGTGRDSKP